MRGPRTVRLTSVEPRYVDALDMQEAMGHLYDPTIPIPSVRYTELSMVDCHQVQQTIQTELISGRFSKSGPDRERSWSDSWAAVRDRFRESGYDLAVLDPPYVSANPTVRWLGAYARAETEGFEMEVYRYVRESVFRRYMSTARAVHDVGAGSCFNAAAYCRFNRAARVMTYDWAPAIADIADDLRRHHGMRVHGHHFNFFEPSLTIDTGDTVMTTCAMEQLGENWRPFLDHLLSVRPGRVVHVEPILEKYEEDKGFDAVAREYHLERGYLRGYYPELLRLHAGGRIKILCDHRTGIGGRYHECYTVLVWEPC